MSSNVLGTLAALHRRVAHERGRIGLIGLEPLLREMVRICSLEPMFDIYANESEAVRKTCALRENKCRLSRLLVQRHHPNPLTLALPEGERGKLGKHRGFFVPIAPLGRGWPKAG